MNFNLIKNKFFKGNIESFFINLSKECFNYLKKNKVSRLENKNDGTEISSADLAIDNIIYKNLKLIDTSFKIISEERSHSENDFLRENYWLIDPIDGTKNFLNGGEQFTLNISFISKGQSIFGFIAHPPTEKVWISLGNKVLFFDNKNNLKKYIIKKDFLFDIPVLIVSKYIDRKTRSFITNINSKKTIELSSSLKFCYLIEKKAYIYPRMSLIKKWDIAAGHALLCAVGGELFEKDNKPFKYNYPSVYTTEFVASYDINWKKKINFKHPFKEDFTVEKLY